MPVDLPVQLVKFERFLDVSLARHAAVLFKRNRSDPAIALEVVNDEIMGRPVEEGSDVDVDQVVFSGVFDQVFETVVKDVFGDLV